ncbi:AsmA family protein [Desulfobulbus propionicus]
MRKGIIVKIGIALAALVAIVVIGAIIAVKSVNLDQIKEMLATQVHNSTGRTLTISGPVKMQLGLVPRVVLHDVSFSNPPGSSRPEMVKIKRFEMEVALKPLLNKEVMVNRLVLASPDIIIETEPRGPGNLAFKVKEKQEQPPAAPEKSVAGGDSFRFSLNEVKIEQGKITLYDRASQKTDQVVIHLLDLMPNKKDATRLDLQLVTTVRDHKVDLSGTIGRIGAALSGAPWPLQLKALVEGVTLNAEGSIADLTAFHGLKIALTAQGDELAGVLKKAGFESPRLPSSLGPFALSGVLEDKGKQLAMKQVEVQLGKPDLAQIQAKGAINDLTGTVTPDMTLQIDCKNPADLASITATDIPLQGPVTFTGKVSGSEKQWTISDIVAMIGKSDLKGSVQVQLATRSRIAGQLSSNFLDLADFTAPQKNGGQAASGASKAPPRKGDGRLFSDQPLPLAGLRSVDADLKVQVGRLKLDARQLRDLQVAIQLKDGRLAVAPFRFGLAGGVFEGKVHLDSAPKTPILTTQLNGRQFEVGKLQEKSPITGGKSDLKVDVKGSGNSVRALMASLTGETVLSVGEGRLQNKAINWAAGDLLFQVLGAINPFVKSEDSTQMTCAVVRFVLRNGVATTDNGIAMRTDKVDVIGSGTVNLRTEQLDLGIKPKTRGGIGVSLSSPLAGLVRVKGTLAKPSMGIDAAGTLKTAASIGAGVATGGLSTVGELLVEKVTADDDPCRTALGLKQLAQPKSEAQQESKKPIQQDLLKGVKGLFNR